MDRAEWQETQRALRRAVGAARGTDSEARRPGTASPLVSVIVAAWNAAETIERCLTHLLMQDYEPREIIVVDDGSTDETTSIVRRLHRPVTLIEHPRNRGLARARNTGLGAARGEIVAFMDSDGFADIGWLSALVGAFAADPSIGGVASTVFIDSNPIVINGAGGTTNRQGWAADLAMGSSYEYAQMPEEALYAMGCGMAFRRVGIERIGGFDDHIRNYYDDVDYGIRVWRAGYRIAVAADAWIDHGWAGGARSDGQTLLCERHRMRVVLKHAPASMLMTWWRHEVRSLRRAKPARRLVKLRALAWNARHSASALIARWRLRRMPDVPDRLIDSSWGDAFPVGLPDVFTPHPERARSRIDMAEAGSEEQLILGWFPVERADSRSYRWAGQHAATFVRLDAPAGHLRLDYAHVPVDTGGVTLEIRCPGGSDPLEPVWATQLAWQYIARSSDNHPLALAAGDYEVVFRTGQAWREPPNGERQLGFALARMELEPPLQVGSPGELDMARPDVASQLVSGWFEPEQERGRSYRWTAARAGAIVRLAEAAGRAIFVYRLPPHASEVAATMRTLGERDPIWSAPLRLGGGEWCEEELPADLPMGEYLLSFEAHTPWSNPDRRDPSLWPENRTLGLAVASVSFVAVR